jgi:hypothetical protein
VCKLTGKAMADRDEVLLLRGREGEKFLLQKEPQPVEIDSGVTRKGTDVCAEAFRQFLTPPIATRA